MVAPFAVKVEEAPIQIAVGFARAVIVGTGVTTRLNVVVLVQPKAVLPVTVYTVVAVGVTTIAEPVKAPGFHV